MPSPLKSLPESHENRHYQFFTLILTEKRFPQKILILLISVTSPWKPLTTHVSPAVPPPMTHKLASLRRAGTLLPPPAAATKGTAPRSPKIFRRTAPPPTAAKRPATPVQLTNRLPKPVKTAQVTSLPAYKESRQGTRTPPATPAKRLPASPPSTPPKP